MDRIRNAAAYPPPDEAQSGLQKSRKHSNDVLKSTESPNLYNSLRQGPADQLRLGLLNADQPNPEFKSKTPTKVAHTSSPVHSLPVELILSIWELLLISHDASAHKAHKRHKRQKAQDGHKRFKTAIVLSHVCSRWRQIALARPSMWTFVRLSFDFSLENVEDFWTTMLPRFGTTPVDISIANVACGTMDSDLDLTGKLLACNLKAVPRIRKLLISLSSTTPAEVIGPLLRGTGYPMEKLEICGVPDLADKLLHREGDGLFGPVLSDPDVLKFRKLVLRDLFSAPLYLTGNLDLLTYLKISDCDESVELLHLLPRCPNLEELHVNGAVYDSSPEEEEGKIVTNLRYLSVQHGSLLNEILRRGDVHFPRLAELIIESDFPDNFLTFVSSLPSLVTLTLLNDVPDEISGYRNLPSAAPRVTTLETYNWVLELLLNWRSLGRTTPPFPYLRSLSISTLTGGPSLEEFEELVRRRCLPLSSGSGQAREKGVVQLSQLEFATSPSARRNPWLSSRLKDVAMLKGRKGRFSLKWPLDRPLQ